jgi:hypothetical protein
VPTPVELPQPTDVLTGDPGDFGRVSWRAAGMSLELPNPRGWRQRGELGSFWLEHPASGSVLKLRYTSAERRSSPSQCADQAARADRSLGPLLELPALEPPAKLTAPSGFEGTVSLALDERENEAKGSVLAVGARTGRCFVAWFTTRAEGTHAMSVVLERLIVLSEHSLPSVRLRSVESRVERAR